MGLNNQAIAGLREALRVSPNDLPLRRTLADLLLADGEYAMAEAEYKAALGLSPNDRNLKARLAEAFYGQQKHSLAMVIVEDLLKREEPSGNLLMLHARSLLGIGDVAAAARHYQQALRLDPALAAFDEGLAVKPDDDGLISSRAVCAGGRRAVRRGENGRCHIV